MKKIFLILFIFHTTLYCESQTSWEFILLGSEKDKLNDFQGAILDYNKAIKISPDSSLAYLFRALSKLSMQDNAGAIVDYTKGYTY